MELLEVVETVPEVIPNPWTEERVLELFQYLSDFRTLLAWIFFMLLLIYVTSILYTVLCKILFK